MKKIVMLLLVIGLFILPSVSAWSVGPAVWEINMMEDYEITKLDKMVITIKNSDKNTIKVKLTAFKEHPEQSIKDGYKSIPKLSYVDITQKEVTVEPNSSYEVPVIINIENKTENYNQNWQVWFFCEQTGGGVSGNGGVTFKKNYWIYWTIKTPERYVPIEERNQPNEFDFNLIPILGIIGVIAVVSVIYVSYKKKGRKPSKNKDIDDVFN